MKIVILDVHCENPGDLSWSVLEALGELTVYDSTPLDDEEDIPCLPQKTASSRRTFPGRQGKPDSGSWTLRWKMCGCSFSEPPSMW